MVISLKAKGNDHFYLALYCLHIKTIIFVGNLTPLLQMI